MSGQQHPHYIRVPFTKKNTPANRYCTLCRNGFLHAHDFRTHFCHQFVRRLKSRYRCIHCRYECMLQKTIQQHVATCRHEEYGGAGLLTIKMTDKNTSQALICPRCMKAFTTINACTYHKTSCLPSKKATQYRPSYKYICKVCGKEYVMRRLAKAHYVNCKKRRRRRNQGRGGINLAAQWGVTSQTVVFHQHTYNIEALANKLYADTMALVHNDDGLSVKVMLTFTFVVEKGQQEVDVDDRMPPFDIYFHTANEVAYACNYLDQLKMWTSQVLNDLDEWNSNGSGFNVVELKEVLCEFVRYEDYIGGEKPQLPPTYFSNGRLVNIINIPNPDRDCLHICLAAAKYIRDEAITTIPIKTTRSERAHVGLVVPYSQLDLTTYSAINIIPTPVPFYQLPTVSKLFKNLIYINVFNLINKDKGGFTIVPSYVGVRTVGLILPIVNILYYNSHFYLIFNLRKLILYITNTSACKHSLLCERCLQFYDPRYISTTFHTQLCVQNKNTKIVWPEEGDTFSYSNYALQLEEPYFFVADFESTNTKVAAADQTNTQYGKQLTEHNVNSYAYYLYIAPDLYNFPYDQFPNRLHLEHVVDDSSKAEEELLTKFILSLRADVSKLQTYSRSLQPQKLVAQLHKLHADEYAAEKECVFCKKSFTSVSGYGGRKVLHHCHFKNKYIGAAHSSCNLKARKNHKPKVWFHNVNYDMKLLLRYIGKQCMSEVEKDGWQLSMIGEKIKFVTSDGLDFRDSYQILPVPLAELGSQLQAHPEWCVHQKLFGFDLSDKGKGIYPYSYVDTVAVMDQTTFPSFDDFHNLLGKSITSADYEYALHIFNTKCATFRDYHDIYLKQDIAIVIDALLYFTHHLLQASGGYKEGLYLNAALTLPQWSFQVLLRMGKVDIDLISDPNAFALITAGIKGGMNIASKRVTEIEPKNRDNEHIFYWDAKSLYPTGMLHHLPTGGYEFDANISTIDLCNELSNINLNTNGMAIHCDLMTPLHLHEYLNDLPPIIEKRLFSPADYPPQYPIYELPQKVPKLTAHLAPATNYVVSASELIVYLKLGICIMNVHSVLRYKVSNWGSAFITKFHHLRQEAIANDNKALSTLYKLIHNASYGKFNQDPMKWLTCTVVTNRDVFQKKVRSARYVSSMFNENNCVVKMQPRQVKRFSPVIGAFHILGAAHTHMLQLYYFHLKPAFTRMPMSGCIPTPYQKSVFRLIYMDTDSLVIYIKMPIEEVHYLLKTVLAPIFDFSTLPLNHPLYSQSNNDKIGVLKDEVKGATISGFWVATGKVYALSFFPDNNRSDIKKCKGMSQHKVKEFTIESYRRSCQLEALRIRATYYRIGTLPRSYVTITQEVHKAALNGFDTKRYVHSGGTDSNAHGHFNNHNMTISVLQQRGLPV